MSMDYESQEPLMIDEMRTAFAELHGCMIRRNEATCEVRKEFLSVAMEVLDWRIRDLDTGGSAERLQAIIDSRPAINAGLPQTYIDWSQSIYTMEAMQAMGIQRQ